ncbi:MAG: hypothetical protein Q4D79_13300 [Propionibacteriaceae bacterium]|nr:hypothetical protein [Propionibacteriaceae bacterium]
MLHPVLRPKQTVHASLKLDGWTLVAVIVCAAFLILASVMITETPVAGTGLSQLQLLLAPAVAALASATAMKLHSHSKIERPSRALVVAVTAFALLLLWAAASLPLVQHWASVSVGEPTAVVPVPRAYLLSPLITAALTCLLAILAVNLAPPQQLFQLLWWFAIAGVFVTPAATLYNAQYTDVYGRLETRLGGAAVLHTALLLGLAICVAAVLSGFRRLWSTIAAVAYLGFFLATGARAGLLSLGLFLALVTFPALISALRRRPGQLPLIVGGAVLGAGAFAFTAHRILLSRGFDITGGGRIDTWAYGLHQLGASLGNLVFGVGYGVLWPWYAFEARALPQPGAHGDKQMPEGMTLSHAHNLYIAVLSEQGLVGLGLLAIVLGTALWALWRAREAVEKTLAAGLVATLPSFAFDTYLTKNFPVSFIWWVVLAALLTLMSYRRRSEQLLAPTRPRVLNLGSR